MLELHPAYPSLRQARRADEHVVGGALEGDALDSRSARGIALWVAIDQQRAPLCDRETCREIYRRRGLPDAALLIGNGNDSGHWISRGFSVSQGDGAGIGNPALNLDGLEQSGNEPQVPRREPWLNLYARISRKSALPTAFLPNPSEEIDS
jgi:hypothetical protein